MNEDPTTRSDHQATLRDRLITAAVAVIAEHGIGGFSARRVSAAAGTSTMGVYTQFGSMDALVDAIVAEAFIRLEARLCVVPASADPVQDVAAQTIAYVDFATENPDLYGVMFGTIPLGPYRRTTAAELQTGRTETLDRVGQNLARAAAEGRIRPLSTTDLAFMWWSTVHGYSLLETGGYIHAKPGRARILQGLIEGLFAGVGDEPIIAAASVTAGITPRP